MEKRHIHVVGAVIIKDGKILCTQRGATNILALKWEFPGGKIEDGEIPEEALKREIDEELACNIEVGAEIDKTVYEYDFGIVHLRTYICRLMEGIPVLIEHTSLKWLPREELSSLDWAPADLPTVEKLVNGVK